VPFNPSRRIVVARLLPGLLPLLLLLGPGSSAAADTRSQLERARHELASLESHIHAQRGRLDVLEGQIRAQEGRLQALQKQLDVLAGRIDEAQGRYERTRAQIEATQAQLREARARLRELQAQLDARARAAYEVGPAGSLQLLLGSTSVSELSDRVEFVDRLAQSDTDLANAVQDRANALDERRAELMVLLRREQAQLRELQRDKQALDSKFAQQQAVFDRLASQRQAAAAIAHDLEAKQSRIGSLVSSLQNRLRSQEIAAARSAARQAGMSAQSASSVGQSSGSGTVSGSPFSVCPVAQPRAYSDSFGAPRYAGGYHPHAGNDIMAPRGTPIYAPFSGTASADPNGLGGNAVIVSGSQGWVYNAHLNSYGHLGGVSAGAVIGYVGDSGDARGGPTHDHFEWHPNVIPANPYRSSYGYTVIGDAIDPYPYLNQVC
jgi:peptidoglycan hydrolase CwlO-like protein